MTLRQKAKRVWTWFDNAWTVKDVVVFVVSTGTGGAFIGATSVWLLDRELNFLGVSLAAFIAAVFFGTGAYVVVRSRLKPALLSADVASDGASPSQARRQDERRGLIRQARSFVASACAVEGANTSFQQKLESTSLYYRLRPHLSPEFRRSMNGRTFVVPPDNSSLPGLAHYFLDELDRLEREWEL